MAGVKGGIIGRLTYEKAVEFAAAEAEGGRLISAVRRHWYDSCSLLSHAGDPVGPTR